jgi:hypothetical protein
MKMRFWKLKIVNYDYGTKIIIKKIYFTLTNYLGKRVMNRKTKINLLTLQAHIKAKAL